MDMLVKVFKAVANEKRVKILRLLVKEKEVSVEEIAQRLKIGYKTASSHLQKLINVNLVKRYQKSLFVFYSINEDKTKIYDSAIIDVLKKTLDD